MSGSARNVTTGTMRRASCDGSAATGCGHLSACAMLLSSLGDQKRLGPFAGGADASRSRTAVGMAGYIPVT